jgi:hypothetical protein
VKRVVRSTKVPIAEPSLLRRRLARPFAAIALDLSHPNAKPLSRTAQFTRDRRQRHGLALILIAVFHRQPHRTRAELGRLPLRGFLLLCLYYSGQFSERFALR